MHNIIKSTIAVNCHDFGVTNLELLSCENNNTKNKSPLLFIHGSFHAAWCWAENFMPYFANLGYRVYALSLRGHGESDGHQMIDEYNLNNYVDDIAATVATFDQPPVLIGHSYGGVIIQQYMQRPDNRCKDIILLASPKPYNASKSAVLKALRHPFSYLKLMRFNKGRGEVPAKLFFSNELPNAVMQSYLQRMQRQSQRVFDEFKTFNIKQVPPSLASCLVVVAEKGDKFITLRDAKKTAQFYSGTLTTVQSSGHDMMLEKRWKNAADAIRNWLENKVDNQKPVGSYQFESISTNARHELKRLQAQVDMFWKQELSRYTAYGMKDGMKILDAGCGWAYLSTKLCDHLPAAKITALEQDAKMIKHASQYLAEKKMSDKVLLIQSSITESRLESNQFDFIIARLLLEHLPDPSLGVNEIYRLLKPNGTAVFISNDFDFHTRTFPEVSTLKVIYDAYQKCRQTEGGHPTIGRYLPELLRKASFIDIEFDIMASHNAIVGDQIFFDSEGMGIPLKLVQQGYLSSEQLATLVKEWNVMLADNRHILMRQLFMSKGKKLK